MFMTKNRADFIILVKFEKSQRCKQRFKESVIKSVHFVKFENGSNDAKKKNRTLCAASKE